MIEESSAGGGAAAADPVSCPYLGLGDDRASHFAFATTAHRCHSAVGSELIAVSHQAALCLTADHPTCRRYIVPAATGARPTADPVGAGMSIANVGGRVQGPGATHPQRGRVIRAAVILVGALSVAIVGVVALGLGAPTPAAPSGVAGSLFSAGQAGPVRTPATSPASPASPAAILASPQPTPSDSAAPTSTASATPTASVRVRPTIHIVVRGETLTSIARVYGVTLIALEEANPTIENPSLIVVGQRLIIPPP